MSAVWSIQLVRIKYRVMHADGRESIHVPGMLPEVLLKLKAGNGLLADVVVSKLVDHLPVYRQVNCHARQGVHLSRSYLCDWLMNTADVLMPLYRVLKKRDNNTAEMAVKPFAIGRKNWL